MRAASSHAGGNEPSDDDSVAVKAYESLLESLAVPQALPPLTARTGNPNIRMADGVGGEALTLDGGEVFNLVASETYAKLVSISYCSNASVIRAWTCSRCQRVPSFIVHRTVFDTTWSLDAFTGYLPDHDAIVAVFRGTDNHQWSNWMQNLRFWRRTEQWHLPGAPVSAKVHAGFLNMWRQSEMRTNITESLRVLRAAHPRAALVVTGHSMGAALAQFAALTAKAVLGIEKVHAYTFGSPRVGNLAFTQFFQASVDSDWRFTHERDVVPSLPPTIFGYHHTAREVYTVDVPDPLDPHAATGLDVTVCDASGEDPACHNSACLLGLCTSVADHLSYLTFQMYHSDAEC